MRSASVVAFGLLVVCVALAPAQDKTTTPAPEKAPAEKPRPMRATLSTYDEVEGKNLTQWAEDLQNPDPSVREKAISIIPVYGASASALVPEIIKRLDPKEDLGPRTKAIMALGVMELQEGDKIHVILALSDRLEHDEQHAAKLLAAVALSRFGEEGKPAISALIAGINDPGSWQIRKACVMALRRIGSDRKDGPNERATKSLAFLVKHEKAYEVRLEAIQALGYMDRPSKKENYDLVQRVLKDKSSQMAADQSPDNTSTIEKAKIEAMWAHVGMMAIDPKNEKVWDEGIKYITTCLSSKSLEVRGQAVLCIGTLSSKAKRCVPNLITMLKDKDMGIAITACWALVSVGEKDPKAIDAMTELADKKETSDAAREQIKAAIAELKNSKKAEAMAPKDSGKPDAKPDPKH